MKNVCMWNVLFCLEASVYLGRQWLHSHDRCSQPFLSVSASDQKVGSEKAHEWGYEYTISTCMYTIYTHCFSLLLDIMQARRYLSLCYGAESSISKGSSHDCTSVTVHFNWAELHAKSYNHSLIEMRAQLSLFPDLLTTAFLPCSTNSS